MVVGEAWRPRQGNVCLHSAVRGICAKKDNDHQIQSACDHCRSLPHDRPGATEHRRSAKIHRLLHGMRVSAAQPRIPLARVDRGNIVVRTLFLHA